MTARNDLDNAFSILDAGITAHVAALKSAKASLLDDSYLQDLTVKVIAFADTLAASNPVEPIAVVPAAVILTPAVQQEAQVAQVIPVVATAPVVAPAAEVAVEAPPVEPHAPTLLETMADAVRQMTANASK